MIDEARLRRALGRILVPAAIEQAIREARGDVEEDEDAPVRPRPEDVERIATRRRTMGTGKGRSRA